MMRSQQVGRRYLAGLVVALSLAFLVVGTAGLARSSPFYLLIVPVPVVIALFLRSPTFQTLPVQMYNSVTVEIDPTISAASSLIVVAVTIIFLVPQLVGTRTKSR